MTFRQLRTPNLKIIQRDQKVKQTKCKCHHYQQEHCSKKLNKSTEEVDELCDRLYQEAQKLTNRKIKLQEKVKADRQQKQMQECTFAPEILSNPRYFVSTSSFLDRQLTWSASKEKKIKLQKQKKSSLQTVGCEFTPKIIKNSEKILTKMKSHRGVPFVSKKNPEESEKKSSYSDMYNKNKNRKKLCFNQKVPAEPSQKVNLAETYEQTNESTQERHLEDLANCCTEKKEAPENHINIVHENDDN